MTDSTIEKQFNKLLKFAGWDSDAVQRLCQTCAEKGFITAEQRLAYAQKVLLYQNLSEIKVGDIKLRAFVLEAFRGKVPY